MTTITTIATVGTQHDSTYSDSFVGSFGKNSLVVDFGEGGELSPSGYKLNVTRRVRNGAAEPTEIRLTLQSKNSSDNTVEGSYGYPKPFVLSGHSYGYGFGGSLEDCQTEILQAVSDATDFDLVDIVTKLRQIAALQASI